MPECKMEISDISEASTALSMSNNSEMPSWKSLVSIPKVALSAEANSAVAAIGKLFVIKKQMIIVEDPLF